MFDLDRCFSQWYNRRYNRPIVAPIHIKHVHSTVYYQWATYQKYDQRGCELPSAYGALVDFSSADPKLGYRLPVGSLYTHY